MEFELYNFDHTFKTPREIRLGPFIISITQTHCDNLDKIPRRERYVYTLDENLSRVVLTEAAVEGEWSNTATIKINETSLPPSLLVPEEKHLNAMTDLCNLLTFLTGRTVTVGEFLTDHNPKQALNKTAVIHNIVFWGTNCWNNLPNINKFGLGTQFINFAYAFESNELLAMFAYISSTLDRICSRWWQHKTISYIDKNTKAIILRRIENYLNRSLSFSIRKKLKNIFHSEGVSNNISEDILQRLRGIMGEPSALYKMKELLKHLGVYPIEETEDSAKRLRYLNQARNDLVHNGDIQKLSTFGKDAAANIAVCATLLCLSIVQLFFAKEMLQIDDHGINEIKKDISDYFQAGRFRGMDIFSETYADYLERIANTWTNEAALPGQP